MPSTAIILDKNIPYYYNLYGEYGDDWLHFLPFDKFMIISIHIPLYIFKAIDVHIPKKLVLPFLLFHYIPILISFYIT